MKAWFIENLNVCRVFSALTYCTKISYYRPSQKPICSIFHRSLTTNELLSRVSIEYISNSWKSALILLGYFCILRDLFIISCSELVSQLGRLTKTKTRDLLVNKWHVRPIKYRQKLRSNTWHGFRSSTKTERKNRLKRTTTGPVKYNWDNAMGI